MSEAVAQGRFALLHLAILLCLATAGLTGGWSWLGGALFLAAAAFADLGDADYRGTVRRPVRAFLDALLFSGPPLVLLMLALLLLQTATPGTPAAALAERLGVPAAAARGWLDLAGLAVTSGLLAGGVAISFAHDLLHRPDRRAQLLARLVYLRCLHPGIGLAHLHGHHVHVGTPADPATPPRGMGFWRFLPRAYVGEIRTAAAVEAARLRRRGRAAAGPANRVLQDSAGLLALLLLAWGLAGPIAVLALLASGFIGLVIIALGNYVLHYGLVRAPGRPVAPRHSWNGAAFFATSVIANGQRHSHHHAAPRAPFWALTVLDGGPVFPVSTGLMSLIALLPPLWHRIMAPHIAAWDRDLASPEERAILDRQATRRPARPRPAAAPSRSAAARPR